MLKRQLKSPAKTLVWTTAALVLVALMGTLVVTRLSAHGGANTDVVHLCVNDNSGKVEVVDADATCRNNWSPLDIKAVPPPVEVTGAALDAMVHPMSPALTERITGGGGPAAGAAQFIDLLDEANVDKAVMMAFGFFAAVVPDAAAVAIENDFVSAEVDSPWLTAG